MYLKGPIKVFIANLGLGIRSAMAAWPYFSTAHSLPSTSQELCAYWSPVAARRHINIRWEIKNQTFQQSSVCHSQHIQSASQMHQRLHFFPQTMPTPDTCPKTTLSSRQTHKAPWALHSHSLAQLQRLPQMHPQGHDPSPKPTPKATHIPEVIPSPKGSLSATVTLKSIQKQQNKPPASD